MRSMFSSTRFANVTSVLALVVALSGTSYAAISIPKNSVGSPQIKDGGVATSDLRDNAVKSGKVANGTLRRADIKASELAKIEAALPTTAPSGAKFYGNLNITGGANGSTAGSLGTDDISLPFRFSSVPQITIVQSGTGDAVNCLSGTSDAPKAAPGNICIYVYSTVNADPLTNNTPNVDGVTVYFNTTGSGYGFVSARWAATAP